MAWNKAKKALIALACAGIPLITTASCDPHRGTLSFFRQSDHQRHGFFDVLIDDWFYDDDCFFGDCYYDDYEEIIVFD